MSQEIYSGLLMPTFSARNYNSDERLLGFVISWIHDGETPEVDSI